MGLIPKYKIGEWVVDTEVKGSKTSLVRVINRDYQIKNCSVRWQYVGEKYEFSGNPLELQNPIKIERWEESLASLESRIGI